ncbi:MAG: hypothetical protein K1W24_02215 [Lachnospiraceae bacterium]
MKDKSIKFVFRFALLAAAGVYMLFININICKASALQIYSLDDGSIKMGTGDIVATCSFGYMGWCKYSKFVRADILIESRKIDLNGKFRVENINNSPEDSTMVQQDFSVKAGGQTMVQFAIPYIEETSLTRISLCDGNDEVICYKFISLNQSVNSSISQVYTGILSDSSDGYLYMKRLVSPTRNTAPGDRGIVFILDGNSITDDARMLDSLDVIIIDGYNSSQLSEGQAEALRQWTEDGGTLFIGGGSGADKVFKALNGWLTGVGTGKKLKINTDFGIKGGEKVLTDITQISLKDSVPVLTDNGENLVTRTKYGMGNVFVAEFPLAFTEEEAAIPGSVTADIVVKSISRQRKKEAKFLMSIHGTDKSAAYMRKTITLNETGALPNIKLYAVIMLVYVLLAGPGAYFLAKKKDKRSFLWVVVPSLSAAFAALVYLTGTSTRIQKPYINFVSTLDLSTKIEKENPVNTIFSVTSPDNGPYEMEFPVSAGIMPVDIADGSYGMLMEPDNLLAGYGTEYSNGTSRAVINNLPAFSSAYFQLENKRTSTGTIEVKVSKDGNGLLGTISNNISCTLENCILYHNGRVYYIKELLPGETYDITTIKNTNIYETKNYNNDFQKLIENIMGGSMESYNTNNVIKRKIGMIMTLASSSKPGGTWFYGFMENGHETGFADLSRYKSYGETGVYKHIDIA